MSSYASEKTTIRQTDTSVQSGEAQNVLGSGAKQTATGAGSVIFDVPSTSGDIVFNQFPEAVRGTIGSLIGTVESTTKALGQTLSQQQLGGEAIIPKVVMYVIVGGGLIFVASRIFKR